ncbi:unnamed protein product [Malus baccata var. baccata]
MVALIPQENMVAALVSRTGRHMQRYSKGHRQVVGCIPYRYKASKQTPFKNDAQELEVLVISSQKGKGMLFPKGGWELDESKEGAAARETLEEAGVRGLIEEQLDFWPEKNLRQRIWMSVEEAREVCQHWWMNEALDRLVNRLTQQQKDQGPLVKSRKENLIACL